MEDVPATKTPEWPRGGAATVPGPRDFCDIHRGVLNMRGTGLIQCGADKPKIYPECLGFKSSLKWGLGFIARHSDTVDLLAVSAGIGLSMA